MLKEKSVSLCCEKNLTIYVWLGGTIDCVYHRIDGQPYINTQTALDSSSMHMLKSTSIGFHTFLFYTFGCGKMTRSMCVPQHIQMVDKGHIFLYKRSAMLPFPMTLSIKFGKEVLFPRTPSTSFQKSRSLLELSHTSHITPPDIIQFFFTYLTALWYSVRTLRIT